MLFLGAPELYLKFLNERKETLEKQEREIAEELRIIKDQYSVIQAFINPKVSISVSKMPNGKDRYIGRFMATFPDKSIKQVSVNLGPTQRFKSKDDPELIAIAKEKAVERFVRINPDYLSDSFKRLNLDTLKR